MEPNDPTNPESENIPEYEQTKIDGRVVPSNSGDERSYETSLDGLDDDTESEEEEKEDEGEKKSRVPLYVVGAIVVASLGWTALQGLPSHDETPSAHATATSAPSILATPESSDTPDGSPSMDTSHSHDSDYFPTPVPDPEQSFTASAPPPVAASKRAIPNDKAHSIQAPEMADWKDTVTPFMKAWSNPTVGKEKWLAGIKPYVSNELYENFKNADLKGKDKLTVKAIEEQEQDATGYAFRVTFDGEHVKDVTGTVSMDQNDSYKWKVTVLSEDG